MLLMKMVAQTTEYKLQWDDKYLANISGFANAQGGTIYIGINDKGEVVGINNAKYLLENLPNKAIQATGLVPDIEILRQDGKEYLAIRIKTSDQPVSCNGKYYMRSEHPSGAQWHSAHRLFDAANPHHMGHAH